MPAAPDATRPHLAAVLRALAQLAPTTQNRPTVARRSDVVWLGEELPASALVAPDPPPQRLAPRRPLDRLEALDELHRHEHLLRVGWGWLVGRDPADTRRRVLLPLLSRPATLERQLRRVRLTLHGDAEFAGGLQTAAAFERRLEPLLASGDPGELAEACARFAGELGLTPDEVGAGTSPLPPAGYTGLTLRLGAAVYLARDLQATTQAAVLDAWAGTPGLEHTALAAVYRTASTPRPPVDHGPVELPVPTTTDQQQAVRTARSAPVTVIAGAPGNGKSHTLVAITLDALARGERVLVATSTEHAADVLTDMFDRQAGPDPIAFGSSARRNQIATRLTSGTADPPASDEITALTHTRDDLRARVAALTAALTDAFAAEARAARALDSDLLHVGARTLAPGAFDLTADHPALLARLETLRQRPDGWWHRQRWRRFTRQLAAPPTVDPAALAAAVELGWQHTERTRLVTSGGTKVAQAVAELAATTSRLEAATGRLLAAEAAVHQDAGRAVLAELARALRSGRGRRRELLAAMDGAALTAALPLWVGTLRDVEDLLPRTAGLFDLVVLDEASQIDQLRAAPALARARRAVVAGDPRQLRHVSFVSDEQTDLTVAAHGLQPLADRLDVRRVSAYDLALAAGPAVWLSEHHRSVPHLIAFSATRFYDRPLHLLTRTPDNERAQAVEVVHLPPVGASDAVHAAEVARAVELAAELAAEGSSLGLIAPLRAQADLLEQALLERFGPAEIRTLGLRTGTVHAMQGSECDVVVATLGLADGSAPATRRFVEDPNLFNVLATRARRRMVVVTSLPPDPGGMLGEFFDHARRPPAAPDTAPPEDRFTVELARELAGLGHEVRSGYPVGTHQLPLVLASTGRPRALDTRPHPDGPAAHLRMRLLAQRCGWEVTDAFPTVFDADPVTAAIALANRATR